MFHTDCSEQFLCGDGTTVNAVQNGTTSIGAPVFRPSPLYKSRETQEAVNRRLGPKEQTPLMN